jgi:hypothetical protein
VCCNHTTLRLLVGMLLSSASVDVVEMLGKVVGVTTCVCLKGYYKWWDVVLAILMVFAVVIVYLLQRCSGGTNRH